MIICTEEIESGVEQPSFLESDKNGIGSVSGTESTIAESGSGSAGFFEAFGNGGIGDEATAAFEDSEDVTRLGDFEAWEWIEVGQDTFSGGFFGSGCGYSLEALRCAIHAVAFAIGGPFFGDGAVVVECSAPEHAAVGHHAFSDLEGFSAMATGGTAADMGDAEISWVHEADEVGVFVIEHGIGADRVG